jgi:cyanophycinase-like exopeptidase
VDEDGLSINKRDQHVNMVGAGAKAVVDKENCENKHEEGAKVSREAVYLLEHKMSK